MIRVVNKPGFLNREILPNENTFSFYKMDYTDCNDFLWPIEIFGIKKAAWLKQPFLLIFYLFIHQKYFTLLSSISASSLIASSISP
jgi:hypothetical protein